MATITRDFDTQVRLDLIPSDWLDKASLRFADPKNGTYDRIEVEGEALETLHAELGKLLQARMTRQKNLDQIAALTVDQVVRSYSGKPGCACGCKGNYSTRLATRKLVLTKLQESAPLERNRDLVVISNRQGGMCFSVDTTTDHGNDRNYTVYVGPGWDN